MIAIDRMTPGSPPAGFSFARTGQGSEGEWTVTADRTAAAGKVIEQTSTDRTDYRFPLAIHESVSAANIDIEVSFKAVGGKTDQAGGIAVRLVDADNYYVARANALEDNVRFYRVVAGRREQLDGANLRVSSNEWHTLGLARGRPALHGLFRWQDIIQRDGQDVCRGWRRGAVDQVRQRDALRSVQDHHLAVTGTQEWPISRLNQRLPPETR